MENGHLLFLYYLAAYCIVTSIGVLHTLFNIVVLHMKSMKEGPGMGEGYEKTKPWHVLYNLLVFPFFAYLYLASLDAATWQSAFITALVWGTLTLVIDIFGWVIVKHPWSLSFKQFYIEYQPWITLIYIAIYASPLLAFGIMSII